MVFTRCAAVVIILCWHDFITRYFLGIGYRRNDEEQKKGGESREEAMKWGEEALSLCVQGGWGRLMRLIPGG